jgi:uncharacterized protein (TIGR02118 family)
MRRFTRHTSPFNFSIYVLKGGERMVKLVAMFNLPEGTDEAEFEKYFVKKHVPEAAHIPGLRRYTIGKVVGSPAGEPAWYRVNELWFDSVSAAMKAFNSKVAVDCTNDLMPRVKDFTPVFVKDQEVKLPSKAKAKRGKGKGGRKR